MRIRHDVELSHDTQEMQEDSEESSEHRARESSIKLVFGDFDDKEEVIVGALQTAKVEALYSFRYSKWCFHEIKKLNLKCKKLESLNANLHMKVESLI